MEIRALTLAEQKYTYENPQGYQGKARQAQ